MKEYGSITGELQEHDLDNIGLRMKAPELHNTAPKDVKTKYQMAVANLNTVHSDFVKQVREVQSNKTLNSDAKDLLIGEIGIKHEAAFKQQMNVLAGILKHTHDSYEKIKKSNNPALNDLDKAMMPMVSKHIEERDTDYLMEVPIADDIANAMANFGLLSQAQAKAVKGYLDNKYTPEAVQAVEWAKEARDTAMEVLSTEERYIANLIPDKEKLKALRASKEIREQMKRLSL